MKIKLRVYYRTQQQGPGDPHVDEFLAADNWKVEELRMGFGEHARAIGSLRVDWDFEGANLPGVAAQKPVRLAKVYAPGEWVTWEMLPE